jgi:hypothetical protein
MAQKQKKDNMVQKQNTSTQQQQQPERYAMHAHQPRSIYAYISLKEWKKNPESS